MSHPNGISPHAPQRPQFPPPTTSYRSDYSQPNGRPSPINQQSPQMMNYNSPSPQQQFSPPFGQPAAKRPRLSPEAPLQFAGSPSAYPSTPTGQAGSPVGGLTPNGALPSQQRPGSMAPPQRPTDRDMSDAQDEGRNWPGTGQNAAGGLRQEQPPYAAMQNGNNQNRPSLNPANSTFSRPSQENLNENDPANQPRTAEEKQKRAEERLDWEASRHTQNPLWDMFLVGGAVNDRMRRISQMEHLTDPQAGVLVNTQKSGPPPIARVNGYEGASRVIDKGQAILDPVKGERLAEILKCVCLASKTRLTGLMSASSRLGMERRQHSAGKVPVEWEDMAVAMGSAPESDQVTETEGGPVANPLKRTHDQANAETTSERATSVATSRSLSILSKVMAEEKAAEDARRAKRAKRKAAADAAAQTARNAAEEEAVNAAVETDKKKSSKAGKAEAAKALTAHQHESSNIAAQMALSGIGKKGKQYSWMKGSGSGTSTPSQAARSASSTAGTPKPPERAKPVVKEKRFGAWDEDKDPGIQARDLLLVLETDGRAPKAYTKGCAVLGE